jgi:hypothetical protein
MSKYLYQSCGPKPMTRVDINDNNQSSNSSLGCECINGHRKNLSKPHCINTATTFRYAATNSLIASCSLSLHWTYILPTQQGEGGPVLAFGLFFTTKGGYTWAVEVTVTCTCGQTLLCPNVHAACPETARVYLGSTFLGSTPTQKIN